MVFYWTYFVQVDDQAIMYRVEYTRLALLNLPVTIQVCGWSGVQNTVITRKNAASNKRRTLSTKNLNAAAFIRIITVRNTNRKISQACIKR